MALTFATIKLPQSENPQREGRYLVVRSEATITGTYVTNGHAFSTADLGIGGYNIKELVTIEFPDNLARNGTNAVVPFWDRANSKIMFFQSTTGAPNALIEVANAQSLSTSTLRITVRLIG